MDRVSVSSSNVDSVGYDVFTAILEVKFNNGSVYWYFGVPPDIAEALVNAGSVGEFLAAHIKGCFDYECKQETTRRRVELWAREMKSVQSRQGAPSKAKPL